MNRKEPTVTSLVLEVLIASDDFMDFRMLRRATGQSLNSVNAACHHLRKRHAIDVIIDPHGVGWWYATPESDDRSYARKAKAPEVSPRRPRKTSKRPPRTKPPIKSSKEPK